MGLLDFFHPSQWFSTTVQCTYFIHDAIPNQSILLKFRESRYKRVSRNIFWNEIVLFRLQAVQFPKENLGERNKCLVDLKSHFTKKTVIISFFISSHFSYFFALLFPFFLLQFGKITAYCAIRRIMDLIMQIRDSLHIPTRKWAKNALAPSIVPITA